MTATETTSKSAAPGQDERATVEAWESGAGRFPNDTATGTCGTPSSTSAGSTPSARRGYAFEELRAFPGLSSSAFQHPHDRQAARALQSIPLFPKVVASLGQPFERSMGLWLMANSVQLKWDQGRAIYEKFVQAAAILDVPQLPELYLSSHLHLNAFATGLQTYRIVLYAPLVDMLTERELLAIIGHELGHVKCQHQLFKTMVGYFRLLEGGLASSGLMPPFVGPAVVTAIQMALLHWDRMAELSCDRAALLVVQDPHVVASALAKLAGASQRILPDLNMDSLVNQALLYDDADESMIDKLLKLQLTIGQSHPFPMVRAKEILEWARSDTYQDALHGNYASTPAAADEAELPRSLATCQKCGWELKATDVCCSKCGKTVTTGHTSGISTRIWHAFKGSN